MLLLWPLWAPGHLVGETYNQGLQGRWGGHHNSQVELDFLGDCLPPCCVQKPEAGVAGGLQAPVDV